MQRCEEAKRHSLLRFELFGKIKKILDLIKRNILISPLEEEKKFLSELNELRNFREGYTLKYSCRNSNFDRRLYFLRNINYNSDMLHHDKNNKGRLGILAQREAGFEPSPEFLSSPQLTKKFNPLTKREGCDSVITDNLINMNHSFFLDTVFSRFTSLFSRKRTAFTLAEVLITLGIIGIVAAMTMPTLISKHEKKVYGTKLIQTYSILNQGFRAYLGQNETDLLSQTPAFDSIHNSAVSSCDPENWDNPACKEFVDEMSKIFNGIHLNKTGVVTYKYLKANGTGTRGPWSFTLNNGAVMYIGVSKNYNTTGRLAQVKQYGTKLTTSVAYLDIDINGAKKPNRWGRDFFEFQVSDEGIVIPEGGKDYSVFRNGNLDSMWNSQYMSWGCKPETTSPKGWGCGARVIEEGGMYY